MSERIIECVPNFSEGRNDGIIKQITDTIEAVEGIRLLDVDPGPDMNRTVVTFIGNPESVKIAAFNAIKKAAELIDMSKHGGSHPRMGATDVCPFVPVKFYYAVAGHIIVKSGRFSAHRFAWVGCGVHGDMIAKAI